jgi:hypothetical protein
MRSNKVLQPTNISDGWIKRWKADLWEQNSQGQLFILFQRFFFYLHISYRTDTYCLHPLSKFNPDTFHDLNRHTVFGYILNPAHHDESVEDY